MATYSYCGNLPILTNASLSQTSPIITNVTIGVPDINIEQSHVIPDGTKKILIKHRTTGKIDITFTTGFAAYIEVPCGTNYSENDLNAQSETLYFRTDVVGIIEILTWS